MDITATEMKKEVEVQKVFLDVQSMSMTVLLSDGSAQLMHFTEWDEHMTIYMNNKPIIDIQAWEYDGEYGVQWAWLVPLEDGSGFYDPQDWKRADTVLFLKPNTNTHIHLLVKSERDNIYDCSPYNFK